MDIPKSSPEAIERFQRVAPTGPEIVYKLMFGFPGIFVNGNMASGLHSEELIVRLGPDEVASLLTHDGAHILEPVPGRPMKEYVVMPQASFTEPQMTEWIRKALAFAGSLPPKEKKPPKPKK